MTLVLPRQTSAVGTTYLDKISSEVAADKPGTGDKTACFANSRGLVDTQPDGTPASVKSLQSIVEDINSRGGTNTQDKK